MNKLDHAIGIKLVKDGKEKLFYLPHFCNNNVWLELYENAITHSLELVVLQVTISR